MGIPQNGWFIRENHGKSIYKWMIWGYPNGTHILGKPHIVFYRCVDHFSKLVVAMVVNGQTARANETPSGRDSHFAHCTSILQYVDMIIMC